MKRILHLSLAALLIALWPACNPPQEDTDNPGTEVVDPEDPENPEDPEEPEDPEDPENPGTKDYLNVTCIQGEKYNNLWIASYTGGRCSYNVQTNLPDWKYECTVSWCKVTLQATILTLEFEPYGTQYDYLYPRSGEVTIEAGNLDPYVITIAQESGTRIGTYSGVNQVYVSPSGAPLDVFINTTYYRWKVTNKADWLKAEQPDNATLRLSVTPRAEGTAPRSAKLTLTSASLAEEDFDAYWDKLYYLYVFESDTDMSGEDFDYGDKQDWD